ncbi:SDR family oxidoreductase [Nitrosomonas oligotropha]|uniref:NAD(P)-dependent dehydrogenase, short-chain alcohol dehydrogenase family n=1 Tax=Nitrosomonas oligotropha TaxID=42354 RepID=A0A1H8R5U9_9PROT|nr:SDR family oxidoreductase [Nitrosomonas oligotropha]SDW83130.1 NAD(P)-dependent dehydrogenase, short-chain alcohol dehydrogenase family [Nitrosomonas oligotropha]SEO61742.1 NAD(P)-dependent dehydrogenase, short-chain alcohol dehydrogenase family [Nitrosomonas oligotropha]
MRTMLITGANRGIGLEFVRQYAADGWRVVACCRKPAAAEALNRLAAQYPDQITVHALDVIDHAQIDQLAQTLSEQPIDLLINNAGVYPPARGDALGETDYAAWQQAFAVNTMAPLKITEAFIQRIARSELKTIATITSKMGSIADNRGGGSYIYRSSKAGVNIVMKSLSIDLNPKKIIAVVLHPGWVKTDMGGPGALITAEQSVTGMRRVIGNLTLQDSGKFYAFDGQVVPW